LLIVRVGKFKLEFNSEIELKFKITDTNNASTRIGIRMGDEDEGEPDRGFTVLAERVKPVLKKPPMYKVVLLNDDYTPMEFVVQVLEIFFQMNREKATQIMLAVHTVGKATCGIYTRDIAETKSDQVNEFAQQNHHPLVSDVEAVEEE
tara:strand:- start:3960 stop:4403 length:444 start_codon:yes stop_codon:yes gene_type:complete